MKNKYNDKEIFNYIQEKAENVLKNKSSNRQVFLMLMVMQSEVTYSDEIPTACVSLSDLGKALIKVNPVFWNCLDDDTKLSTLQHEISHAINEHFSRVAKPTTQAEANMQNIAMDCAINQYIDNFKEPNFKINTENDELTFINYYTFCDSVKLFYSEPIEEMQNFEYYLRILNKCKENIEDIMKDFDYFDGTGDQAGDGTGDQAGDQTGTNKSKVLIQDHSDSIQQGSMGNTDLAKQAFKDLTRRTMSQAGVTPSDFNLYENESNKINWRRLISRFFQKSVKMSLKKTKNRPNRKYGFNAPKRVKNKESRIAVLADVTGSMTSALDFVFSEISSLSKGNISFDLYTVTTELKFIATVKNQKEFKKIEIPTGGCTDFTTALVELNKRKDRDPVIFITDTYGNFPDRSPKYPILILSTEKDKYKDIPQWALRKIIDVSELVDHLS